MKTEAPDAWEKSAQIVEAFANGADESTADLLARIAQAIRDHAEDF